MMYDDYDDEPSLLLPLLIAIAVHALAVVAFIYGYQEKPKPKVVVLQASVMSAKESARLQKSAQQNAKQSASQSTQNNTAKDTKKSTTDTAKNAGGDDAPKPSSQVSEYNARLAERERAYAKELASYTASLDRQIAHDIEQNKQALKEMDEARQREVDALKSRARSNEEIARDNAKELNDAKERLKEQRASEQKQDQTTTQNLTSDNPPPSIPNVGRGGQVGSTSNVSKSEAQANIAGRVQAIWERYKNPKNRHLTATIRIDDNGNLLSVSFGAGDQDLQPSLEASIREASPFPEMKGISKSFSIRFYTD